MPASLTSRTAVALLAFTLLPAAHAHRSFLVPSSTVLAMADKTSVTVDAARGNDLFFFNHNAMPVGGLTITAPDGSAAKPAKLERLRYRTVFDVDLPQPGTWRIAVVDDGLMAQWKENGEAKRWRGSREDFAKNVPADAKELNVREGQSRVETFVTAGKPSKPALSGRGLEADYLTHPNDLYAGASATLVFHHDGKPAAGLKVTIIADGTRYRNAPQEMRLTTDDKGRLVVKWPHAGKYWLNAAVRSKEAAAPATSRSASYTATLEVLPE